MSHAEELDAIADDLEGLIDPPRWQIEKLRALAAQLRQRESEAVRILFDGPPSYESGRFVEVETHDGKSLGPHQTGADWTDLGHGLWALGPFYAAPPDDAALRADAARLDWLEQRHVSLNKHYGTEYGWTVILSPNVVRLMSMHRNECGGGVSAIDVNDAEGGISKFNTIRAAIDGAMKAHDATLANAPEPNP